MVDKKGKQGYAWVVSIVAFMLGIGTITGVMAWGYVSPYIAADFGVEVTDIAIGSSLYNLFMMGCGFAVGMLADRFGPRWVAGIGQTLAGIFLILVGTCATSIGTIIALYAASGIFVACCGSAIAPKIISAWFTPKWRGKGMLPNTLGGSVWGALLGVIIPPLILAGGWKGAFTWLGVIVAVAGIIWLLFARSKPSDKNTVPFGADPETYVEETAESLTPEQVAARKAERRTAIIRVLKMKNTWFFGIAYVVWMMYGIAVATYQVTAIMEAGYSITLAGLIASVNTILIALSMFLWGPLCDKFSRKKVYGFTCVCGGLGFLLIWAVLGAGSAGTGLIVFVFALQGFFTGHVPIQQSIMAEIFPPDVRGTGPGVLVTLSLIGSFIGPLVGGWWIKMLGGSAINIFLWGAILMIAAGILIWLLIPNTGGKYGDPLLEKYNKEHGISTGEEA